MAFADTWRGCGWSGPVIVPLRQRHRQRRPRQGPAPLDDFDGDASFTPGPSPCKGRRRAPHGRRRFVGADKILCPLGLHGRGPLRAVLRRRGRCGARGDAASWSGSRSRQRHRRRHRRPGRTIDKLLDADSGAEIADRSLVTSWSGCSRERARRRTTSCWTRTPRWATSRRSTPERERDAGGGADPEEKVRDGGHKDAVRAGELFRG